jgi:hypothetical protein
MHPAGNRGEKLLKFDTVSHRSSSMMPSTTQGYYLRLGYDILSLCRDNLPISSTISLFLLYLLWIPLMICYIEPLSISSFPVRRD